jgi:hypothetical protein
MRFILHTLPNNISKLISGHDRYHATPPATDRSDDAPRSSARRPGREPSARRSRLCGSGNTDRWQHYGSWSRLLGRRPLPRGVESYRQARLRARSRDSGSQRVCSPRAILGLLAGTRGDSSLARWSLHAAAAAWRQAPSPPGAGGVCTVCVASVAFPRYYRPASCTIARRKPRGRSCLRNPCSARATERSLARSRSAALLRVAFSGSSGRRLVSQR